MPRTRHVVVHGHFYQPPREDPWLDEIAVQPGAAPWHDWNVKIEHECYRAVAAARVLNTDARIARVVNLFAAMSFDVGPTLFEWMERAAPATYAAILEADHRSVERLGHGNALAQPYHHVILPLCTRRDKETEVRWGIADFRRRFGRMPEGMWLPETAVDDETLDVLAQEGILFTVLAPNQVKQAPAAGRPGRYVTANGREIALFVYDGPLSHGVAFGRLLSNARVWKAEMLAGIERQKQATLVSIATDGETFGHHYKFSELVHEPNVHVQNYASVLGVLPPTQTVTLVSPSAWSCEHGVERWRSNCGCRSDQSKAASQQWRAPLREALDLVRVALDARFADEGAMLFRDPWATRDAYGALLHAPWQERDSRLDGLLQPGLVPAQRVRALELLEMGRETLRMYTSCAWFFDDIAGIETVQSLRYAARALDYAEADGERLERALRDVLRTAKSNDPAVGTGEDVWVRSVRPVVSPMARLAAGVAAAQAFVPHWRTPPTPGYDVEVEGKHVRLTSRRTGRVLVYEVTVQRKGVADVTAFVLPRQDLAAGGPSDGVLLAGTVPVSLADFPERERLAVTEGVRRSRRRDLARRLFGEARLAELVYGETTLTDAAVSALDEEVRRVTGPGGDQHVTRAMDLIDLLELMGHHVPFDVQTAFAAEIRELAPNDRPPFAPLAARLGFGEEFLSDAFRW